MTQGHYKLKIFIYRPKPARQTIWANWLFKCEPLELEYLYTVLKDEADVSLIDGQVTDVNLIRAIKEKEPDLLLLTSLVTNVNTVLDIATKVRQLKKPPLTFIGGPHAEVLPQHFFHEAVDGVFYNNQLAAIREAVTAIKHGSSYHNTAGAAFPVNGEFRINPPSHVDIQHFPVPERPLLKKYRHKYNLFYWNECASLKTSFGCPEKCTFCYCRKMNQEEYGRRPLDSVIREIESIPTKNIFIVDDNFLLSVPRLKAFCAAIRERNIRKNFIVYGTARFIANHPDTMRELHDAGLQAVLVGLEFISDDALAGIHKGSELLDNENCIKVCKKLDIELIGLFMLDPSRPSSDYRLLSDFVRKRKIYLATFATLTTLPGTDLWRMDGDKPVDIAKLWRYDFLRLHQKPGHMSAFRYYLWLSYLYLRLVIRTDGFIHFVRKAGIWNTVRMSFYGMVSIVDFSRKLILWP